MLRCIPIKSLGVIVLVYSLLVFFTYKFINISFSPLLSRYLLLLYFLSFVLLLYLGACPVYYPYTILSLVFTLFTILLPFLFII
jgi:hypothetical protein